MSDFNAAQVLAEAYTLYKKHHDGMGLDFKIAITQVRQEAKVQALRDAADALEGRLGTRGAPTTLWEFRHHLRQRADQMEGDDETH